MSAGPQAGAPSPQNAGDASPMSAGPQAGAPAPRIGDPYILFPIP